MVEKEYNKTSLPELSILIVDDEPDIVEIISIYVADTGYFKKIVSANDAVTALSKAYVQDFDLILLDVNMPKKSGLDFIHSIKKSRSKSNIPIIIISGSVDSAIFKEALSHGIRHFIIKPFSQEKVQNEIKKTLKLPTSQDP